MTAPRVRFAPSPTGFLHVGSARTALFCWLYARSTHGTFVLRIEDTDAERNRDELVDVILEELTWLGIAWDEGPLFQSQRRDRHREVVQKLLADDRAYLCDADNEPVPGTELVEGMAVRFRTPDEGVTRFDDVVRGPVEFANADIEDFVVWRSNASPTFLLANAVDDHDMAVTHAIRGEDLLSSAPKVLLLIDAIGGTAPTYAHLPLLVNEQRKKLSKRRDDVSVESYREQGYLPEAMANYLALLGWGPPDDVEIRPMAEIVELFRLEDVNKAPAFFDRKKLEHFNATYIRALPTDEFIERCRPWLTGPEAPWPADRYRPEVVADLAPVVQEKVRLLSDVPRFLDWLFLEDPPDDDDSWQKAMVKGKASAEILDGVIAGLSDCAWEPEAVKELVFGVGEGLGVNRSKSQAPVRVAVTGRTVGPPLFEPMTAHLPRDEVLRRLRAARARL